MESDIQNEKSLFRKQALKVRRGLSPEQRKFYDSRIFEFLTGSEIYKDAENILVYVSYGDEADTHRFIGAALGDGKTVAVPRVTGPGSMEFFRIASMTDLRAKGYKGIPEPGDHCREKISRGLMILPGLAFDRELHRMGYGGGFYDRYIAAEDAGLFKCAIAYGQQVFEKVPCSRYDRKMDMLITQDGLYTVQDRPMHDL